MGRLTSTAVMALALSTLDFGVSAQERPRHRMEQERAVVNPVATFTPSDIEAAIAKAKAYLYAQQHNGNWEIAQTKQPDVGFGPGGGFGGMMGGRGREPETGSQWGGLSSIATFSLLAAGESDTDERIARAIAFLKAGNITGTYALGLHAQVWNSTPPKKVKDYKAAIIKDAGILLKGLRQEGDAKGLYHYTPDDQGWDNSCAQFGVLGMWACSQAGYEAPAKYWKDVEDAWVRHQDKSGGWTYGPSMRGRDGPGERPAGPGPGDRPPGGGNFRRGGGMGGPDFDRVTLSMTAAGVATLYITQDYLHSDAGIDCKSNYRNPAIEAGMKWIVDHYSELDSDRHYYYTLFGISRIGLASGHKFLGAHDWYKEGAAQLLGAQQADGSFNNSVSDTAFALLFLARGRAPIMMNKVEYGVAGKDGQSGEALWDQRPRDCANLARWVGRNIEHDLNWQIVNLKVSPEDLHDAPLRYIGGSKELAFTDDEKKVLRTFAEQGGLILGNADCGNASFIRSFEKLGNALFPKYEFRDLPTDHVMFTAEQYPASKWRVRPKVRGLSNGVRELMALIPDADLSRAWQGRNEKVREEAYQLGADIFLYSVDKKNLRNKGETYIVAEDAKIQTTKSLTVGRLQIGNNPDPEPAGWRRLVAVLHNQKLAITVKDIPCDSASLKGLKVAHLTGTTHLTLNDAQRGALKEFVEAGGTLIVDAAGGSAEFATSAELELKPLFGDLKRLAPESPVFTPGGAKLEAIQYRMYARHALGGDLLLPRIEAIDVKGRPAVLFSREDLSAGLVGEPVDGIYGYDPESATRLMSRILRYLAG